MDTADGRTSAQKTAHERELERERKAAFWILILAMALSATVAMIVTLVLEHH
jgi:hypothetical protein